MELNRLLRVVRDRWVFVVVIGLLGAEVGWFATILSNQRIEPLYEAVVALRLDPAEGETIADLTDELETTHEIALAAAGELLASQPGSAIRIDAGSGRIQFASLGRTQDDAREKAQALIRAYLDIDPTVGGTVDELLTELETEAVVLETQLADIQDVLTPEELGLIDDHDLISLKIDAVRQQIVSLTVADAGASEGEQQDNLERRQELNGILFELETERAALAPRPSAELSVIENLRVRTIQRRLDLLGLEYERLFLRKLGVTTGGEAEPAVFTDLTPPPQNPLVNGALGLILGVGVAVMGLAFITATRKPVWLPEDVPIPVLGEIPGRRTTSTPGPPWYDGDKGSPRKAAIQALRTALEARLSEIPATLGIAGHQVGSSSVHALAADLASSFASAGWSVLLVDADFDDPSDMTEYRVAGTDLASVLEMQQPALLLEKEIARRLIDAVHIREDLAVVPAGQSPASAADVLAGRQFRAFVEEASRLFDLVVLVGSEVTSPATQVQMQRLGTTLLALAPGRSTMPRVDALVHDLTERRIHLHGSVFIQRSARAVLPTGSARSTTPPARVTDVSPIDRLSAYPFPGARASGVIKTSPLTDLANRLDGDSTTDRSAASDQLDDLGSDVLSALMDRGANAYLAVSEYVVSRVEDMLTAVPGQGNVPEAVLDAVTTTGFMPLVPVPGHPTVGDRLKSELADAVGSDSIGEKIEEILVEGSGMEAGGLDSWLEAHFFKLHLERTGNEPQIWHLTSERGAIQVLVAAQRLNRDRLELLATEVVTRAIDRMQGDLKIARSTGHETTSDWIEDRLKDARLFEDALGWLSGGSNDEARIGYPWRRKAQQPKGWAPVWSEGIRPNLAPVQRLGLLPFPVLTDQELSEYLNVS